MLNIEQIYKEHFETVNKYLLCLTYDSNISEELTQETFCRAVKNINSFNGNCKISTWLCQIAKNLWYDELKRRRKLDITDIEKETSLQSVENLEEHILFNENKVELYKRMQQLNEQAREVVYLKITGELTFKEIADIMNRTENWARTTFYRAKQKLKEVN